MFHALSLIFFFLDRQQPPPFFLSTLFMFDALSPIIFFFDDNNLLHFFIHLLYVWCLVSHFLTTANAWYQYHTDINNTVCKLKPPPMPRRRRWGTAKAPIAIDSGSNGNDNYDNYWWWWGLFDSTATIISAIASTFSTTTTSSTSNSSRSNATTTISSSQQVINNIITNWLWWWCQRQWRSIIGTKFGEFLIIVTNLFISHSFIILMMELVHLLLITITNKISTILLPWWWQ